MKYELTACNSEDAEYIGDQLAEFNLSKMPVEEPCEYVVMGFGKKIIDEDGKIIGGCIAIRTVWGTAEVSDLWVEAAYQKQGLGSRLLSAVECEAKEYGCTIMQLDTFDWQAKEFYEKNGYSLFGVLEDCPKGHCRYYLKKIL